MSNTLVFFNSFKERLNNVKGSTASFWDKQGLTSVDDITDKILNSVNELNQKLDINSVEFENSITGIDASIRATYLGVVQNKDLVNLGYVFIVPPGTDGRNTTISQQMFPFLSFIIHENISGSSYEISDLPVYVVNISEFSMKKSIEVNIISTRILGFEYIDVFNRDNYLKLKDKGINTDIKDIEDYDNLLNSFGEGNQTFDLDVENKKIKFKTDRLVTGVALTNQPYWYVIQAYTGLYLASLESYEIDMYTFENSNLPANKTLDAFLAYALKIKNNKNKIIQEIYYGAPGTGKSHDIDELLKNKGIKDDFVFRITIHPEYTYTDFIGQILPTVKNEEITYDFTKGVFTKALEKAYEDVYKEVYLVIEEMSRGDISAIFGDIFQLLDREQKGQYKGYSKYFVDNGIIAKDIIRIADDKIRLPSNFHILGTVNTSDQNVYVMDTAFKRRFDWRYISTKPVPKDGPYLNNAKLELIELYGTKKTILWTDFYGVLNKFITKHEYLDLGEDKQLGQFFVEFDELDSIVKSKVKIRDKLLNYLWQDVHLARFKRDVHLFSSNISNYSDLYDSFLADENIFSGDFLNCVELWEQNIL